MLKRILCIILAIFLLPSAISFASDYDNHWAKEYISNAIERGFAGGTGNGNFEPDRNITRSEFISLLMNYHGFDMDYPFTSFSDVDTSAWYFPAIAAAEEQNIVNGYGDGTFRPNSFLTREDAVTFVCRAYNINPSVDNISRFFFDYSDISEYSRKFVEFSIRNNILKGYENNTIKPKNNITRAEAVVILENFHNISSSFSEVPEFAEGYPKILFNNAEKNITANIKTTEACSIYFKAYKNSNEKNPKKEDINIFIASTPNSSSEISTNIILDSFDDEYTLFFAAVSENGSIGKLAKIKNFRPDFYSSGSGSIQNPFIIETENQLNCMRYYEKSHFKLGNDISLTKTWTPIDAQALSFGSLDGNGHTISNLTIDGETDYSGLFSIISNSSVKNLAIKGNITAKNNVGLFAGKSDNTIISNCIASGTVKSNANNAGGFCGVNNGKIENSLSAVYSVSAVVNAGGFCGSGNGSILNSLSAVYKIDADMYAGGISGINNGGNIENCLAANQSVKSVLTYNTGKITTNKENGKTFNNYSFKDLKSSVLDAASSSDNINGEGISWNEILDKNTYISKMKWDFSYKWKNTDNQNRSFILPVPRPFADVNENTGLTPYAPIKIKIKTDLLSVRPDMHYILTENINFNGEWKIPSDDSVFSGSIDGNGYSIKNITVPFSDTANSYSLFGSANEGIIRNLTIDNIKAETADYSAVLCISNYGIIENCSINGKISSYRVKNPVYCGIFAAINYGTIDNCDAKADIYINANSITAGGICAHNEGFVNNCSFSGNVKIYSNSLSSSSSFGGITGLNNEGFIYNCASDISSEISSNKSYAGGICGLLNSGEIFKTSSFGKIKVNESGELLSDSAVYTGGICGLSQSGLLVDSLSQAEIQTNAVTNYSGGISGYNAFSNIQNTYSLSLITQKNINTAFFPERSLYAGGICGFNESGFISDNVSLGSPITSDGYVKRISNSASEDYLNNNYASDDIALDIIESTQNGFSISKHEIKNKNFFFMPIYKNGKLGWSSEEEDGENAVWFINSDNRGYFLPLLKDVKLQNLFSVPKNLK